MGYFTNKVVVITGAGSGMGRAYAHEFAQCGAKLALMDFDPKGLSETQQQLNTKGYTEVLCEVFDVSNRQAMFAFAEQVNERFGTTDVVINNAGVEGAVAPTWALEPKHFERIFAINFYGVLNGTQAFLPTLLKKKSGHIVNVSSIFGLVGTPNHADYCASKFAVRGFTEALMTELEESPIGVHLVHPGGIATNIQKNDSAASFAKNYLTTPAQDIAIAVRKAVEHGQVKVVYGNDSLKTWLGSNVVPLKWLNKLIWADLKKVTDLTAYKKAGVVKS